MLSHLRWDMIKTNIKEVSQQFSRYKSRENTDNYKKIKYHLNIFENALVNSPDDPLIISKVSELKTKLELHEIEKAKGAQVRSRMKFIEDGERCTSFFF